MQILQYSFGLLPQERTTSKVPNKPLDFHKFINLSSATYPIKSNSKIRQTLSSYPLDANLMYVAMRPLNSAPPLWYYFVECDDALQRIYRLHLVNPNQNGISQYMGSQWMIISHEFAEYLAKAEEGSLVKEYMDYAEHYIIADEGFFNSILRNSRFCTKHENRNFLHLHFDRYVVLNSVCSRLVFCSFFVSFGILIILSGMHIYIYIYDLQVGKRNQKQCTR